MRKLTFLLFVLGCLFVNNRVQAQSIAVKTNALYLATTTLNIGAEVKLSPKWTFDVSGNYNPWTFSDYKKAKHWMVQPEARYWLCESFNGHFFGLHGLGGEFNFSNLDMPFGIWSDLDDMRAEGWYIGAGIGYGYQWVLSDRWNLEAEIGFGFIRADYKKYECVHCGEFLGRADKNYIGPTKAAISLIYIIK